MKDDWDEENKERVYDKDTREQLIEDEEISPEEEGFMEGYDKAF